MLKSCSATVLLLSCATLATASGRPAPHPSHMPAPSSRPGLDLTFPGSLPSWSPPNVGIPTRLPNLPPPPSFNHLFNPGSPSVSTFGDPAPPSHPMKSKITLPSYSGDNGKPLGTSAPGFITIDGQHTKPLNTTGPGIQFDTHIHTTSLKPQTPTAGGGKAPPPPNNKGQSSAGIWHHHKWYWVVDTSTGSGDWQDAGVASPDDDAPTIDDPTLTASAADAPAVSGTPQTRRYFRIHNATGTKLTIHLAYQTLNQQDEWVWSQVLSYDYDPDEESAISDDGWKVNAVRARIWAEGEDGRQWYNYKDKDYWLVPEVDADGNHVYYSPEMAVNTMNFTK